MSDIKKILFLPNKKHIAEQMEVIKTYLDESQEVPVTDILAVLAGIQQAHPKDWEEKSYNIIKESRAKLMIKDIQGVMEKVATCFAINLQMQLIEEFKANIDASKLMGLNNKQMMKSFDEILDNRVEHLQCYFEKELENEKNFLN